MWTNQFIHFFFLTLIDEEKVIHATNEALARYEKLKSKTLQSEKSEEILFIRSCLWAWQRNRFQIQPDFWSWFQLEQERIRKQDLFSHSPVPLEPWIKYQKSCRPEEMVCLVLREILQLSESRIAEALNLSEGTIRYRISHGLHTLGEFTQEQGGFAHG